MAGLLDRYPSKGGILGYDSRPRSKIKIQGALMPRLMPTGECWCGCGKETAIGSFFLSGHDKVAESAVVIVHYGSVAEFIQEHGYGPGGKNPREALAEWRQKGGKYLEES